MKQDPSSWAVTSAACPGFGRTGSAPRQVPFDLGGIFRPLLVTCVITGTAAVHSKSIRKPAFTFAAAGTAADVTFDFRTSTTFSDLTAATAMRPASVTGVS